MPENELNPCDSQKQFLKIQLRRGNETDFVSYNPVLASGEPAFAVDTNILKIGNGIDTWSDLSPIGSGSTGSGGGQTYVYNPLDNRILTSDGSTSGINGESNLTFDGTLLNVSGNLIAHSGTFDTIQFDTTPETVGGYGSIFWDDGEGILQEYLKGGNIALSIGQDLTSLVYNAETTTLNKGEVVYIFGAQGQRVSVKRASSASDTTSAKTFGIVAENISAGSEGWVINRGIIRGIDTNSYNAGDILWLGNTPGTYTTTKNYAPEHLVFVGVVLKKNSSSGRIYVAIQNGYELEELHNVATNGATNGQFLQYNSGSGLWVPSSSGNFSTLIANSGLFKTIDIDGNTGNETGNTQLFLNGTNGNRIDFNASGVAAPAFTTNRSLGTKIVLSPNVASNQVEYALGIEAGAMWFSIPISTSRAFKWYAGTNNIATLFGNGTLNIEGTTSQINVDDLRLDNNILSIATANTDLIVSPNGAGALLADTSGNTRGIYSNDFQRVRTSVSGVAAGTYSVIGGGSDNRTANSYSTVVGGQTNIATGNWSTVCGGDLNNATGSRSVICGGTSNTASATSSSIGGGSNNIANGVYSFVPGGFRGKATRQGELSHAAGLFNSAGDAQHTILIGRRLTTDDTQQILTLNGSTPAADNIFSIPAQTCWAFDIKLSAYNVTNHQGGWWTFRGGIRRNNANSTVLIGTVVASSGVESSIATSIADVVADDTNEALEIRITGVAGKNIRWVGVVDFSQVSYGTP